MLILHSAKIRCDSGQVYDGMWGHVGTGEFECHWWLCCSLFSIDLHFITALIVVLLMYKTVSPYHQSHPPVEPVRPDDKGIKVAERTLLYTDIM